MTVPPLKFPFYAQVALILIGLSALINILYMGEAIILPVIYATLLAIVLNPGVNFLTRHGINRIVAIALTLLTTMLLLALLATFLISEGSIFKESVLKLQEDFYIVLAQASTWVSNRFNISPDRVNNWIANAKAEMLSNSGQYISGTLSSATAALASMILIPVYIFMILYYKPLLLEFIHKLFPVRHQAKVGDVLRETKNVIQGYLRGLLLEAVIVATLNAAGLLVMGVRYAILLGVMGAILNVIPYIGGVLGVALPILIVMVSKQTPFTYILLVCAWYFVVQMIDNHYLVPKVVASKVKINALVAIIMIFACSTLWGVPGMFLSIPLTAIVKVVFDRIDALEPWGFLLGDTMPPITPFQKKQKKN